MAARVFISFSRRQEGGEPEIVELLREALAAAGFAPFKDDQIHGGERWRAAIERELFQCHAAVLVVSKGVIESPWVQHEIAVLTNRKVSDERFQLKILLVGVPVSDLRTEPLDAHHLGDLQARVVDAGNQAARVAEVVADLEPVRQSQSTTPMDIFVDQVLGSLQSARDLALTRAAGELGVAPVPGDRTSLQREVARHLVGVGQGAAYRAISKLQADIGDDEALTLVERVTPFTWVPSAAAALIALQAARASAALCMVCEEPGFTPGQYVARATGAHPPWPMIPLGEPPEEVTEAASWYAAQIDAAVAQRTGQALAVGRMALVKRLLKVEQQLDRRYFFLVPVRAGGLDDPSAALRAAFPDFRLVFVYTGASPPPEPLPAGTWALRPVVSASDEEDAVALYTSCVADLRPPTR